MQHCCEGSPREIVIRDWKFAHIYISGFAVFSTNNCYIHLGALYTHKTCLKDKQEIQVYSSSLELLYFRTVLNLSMHICAFVIYFR